MDQDSRAARLSFVRQVRPPLLVAGIILWLLYWAAAAPPPDATTLERTLILAATALYFGCGAAAAGLTMGRFKVFGICLHLLLALTACVALNNGSPAVGLYILLGQAALFGGSSLVRAGLPKIRPTHGNP